MYCFECGKVFLTVLEVVMSRSATIGLSKSSRAAAPYVKSITSNCLNKSIAKASN